MNQIIWVFTPTVIAVLVVLFIWEKKADKKRIAEDKEFERRQIAAMAMQGLLSCGHYTESAEDRISELAVRQADSLIAALNTKTDKQ